MSNNGISAIMVGNTLVCSINGKLYQKEIVSELEKIAIYEKALNIDTDNLDEIEALIALFRREASEEEIAEREAHKKLIEEAKEKEEEMKDTLEWMKEIRDFGDEDFEVKGNQLFIKGINISIPEFLAVEFEKRRESEEDMDSLQNFWRLLALNPDPRTRENLYKFLINNGMTVTPSGYFVAYRNANIKREGDLILNQFISNEYVKIKNWKKAPKNFAVLQDEDGNYKTKEFKLLDKFFNRHEEGYINLGTVQELYDKMQEDGGANTVYTDAHSGSTTIIIGQPVSIPRSQCDTNPDATCSRGLHLGNASFMSRGYFGSVGLTCLCNPMHVVSVPYADAGKLRTSEYLPVGLAEYDEDGKLIPLETSTFEFDYAEHTEEQLEDMLRNASFESLKEHHIIPPEMTVESLMTIQEEFAISIEEMNKAVAGRIEKAI